MCCRQAMLNPIGTVLGYIAFGIFYALLAAIVYIVLPFLYMKLFRSGTPGSPAGLIASMIGKAVNTAIVGGAMIATAGAAAPAHTQIGAEYAPQLHRAAVFPRNHLNERGIDARRKGEQSRD